MCVNTDRIIQIQSEPRLSGQSCLFGISKQIPSVSQKKKGYKSKGLKSYAHQFDKSYSRVNLHIFLCEEKVKFCNIFEHISFRIGFSD